MNGINLLGELADGELAERLDEELDKANEAVNLTQKPATITITIAITPTAGKHNTATIGAKIDSKLPKLQIPDSAVYDLGNGKYSRRHPDQPQFFDLRPEQINRTTGEVTED